MEKIAQIARLASLHANEEGLPWRAALPLSSRGPAETVTRRNQTALAPIKARIQLTDAGDGD
jgi:hypothetical protein